MVARGVEWHLGGERPPQRAGEIGAGRVDDREVIKPGGAWGGRLAAPALPGVESDVVVISAGRNEGRLVAEALHQLEPQHARIEGQRAVEIGNLQMDVAD